MADQQFRGPDDNPGKYDGYKLIRLGNLGDELRRAGLEANRKVLRSMGWLDVTDVTCLRYGVPFDTNGLGVYMGMDARSFAACSGAGGYKATKANEAEEKARTEMVDGSSITWADGAMPDDVNSHGEGSRVFPEWDPAKHVSPASLHRRRGNTLSWLFCDDVEEETEGERLARFFATSAHEGHEAVRYERPVVPMPDDREWLLPDDLGRVTATFCGESACVQHHWGTSVHSSEVFANDWHNPFLGVPDAIIDEVRGTLRSWTAMRAGQ